MHYKHISPGQDSSKHQKKI